MESIFQSLYLYTIPFFIFTCFLLKWLKTLSTHKNPPPSPSKLPIIGNLHQIGLYPHRSLQALSQHYGSLMLLHFGIKPVLVVSSADYAREVMKTHDLIFSNRSQIGASGKLLYNKKDIATAPYGEYWRQMRSICVLQLLSNKRVKSFHDVREEEVELLVRKINESSVSSSPVNLSEMFGTLTNDVICRVAFGRKYRGGESGNKFRELLDEFMSVLGEITIGNFIPWLGWLNHVTGFNAKVDRIAKEFDEFLEGVIEEHVNGVHNEKDDLVDILLELQKDSISASGFAIERENIKAFILDMFAAGTDTTYTLLEWAMTELLRNPEIMEQLQNEVRGISNGRPNVTEDDLETMHYLRAVIKETLRLYPPVPLLVPRESTQDVKINGYDIAAGTTVFTNAWAIGRDPATWDEADKFYPERFLENNAYGSIDFRGHDFQLIPFGAGRRGCPGISFAIAANELVLATLVKRFDWALPNNGEDLDMTECVGVTIHRKVPLVATATPHNYC